MNELIELGGNLYAYCTDFVINLANLLNLSYYEINFMLFCVLYPLLFIGSFGAYLVQKIRLERLKRKLNTK